MQTTLRSTLILGATALFAVIGTAQAADSYSGGLPSLRGFLADNYNGYANGGGRNEYRDNFTSVRRMVKGIIKDVPKSPWRKN